MYLVRSSVSAGSESVPEPNAVLWSDLYILKRLGEKEPLAGDQAALRGPVLLLHFMHSSIDLPWSFLSSLALFLTELLFLFTVLGGRLYSANPAVYREGSSNVVVPHSELPYLKVNSINLCSFSL